MSGQRRRRNKPDMTGEELAALRHAWGMTQVQLAEMLGMTWKTISEMEGGRHDVPPMCSKFLREHAKVRALRKMLDDP